MVASKVVLEREYTAQGAPEQKKNGGAFHRPDMTAVTNTTGDMKEKERRYLSLLFLSLFAYSFFFLFL